MKKSKKLIIYGTGETAELAYEYFTHDSPYVVAGFTVEKQFLTQKTLCGLPVIPFETITTRYPPETYDLFVALSFTKRNRIRAKYYTLAKKKTYTLATYISSRAFVWRSATIGDNCMIFENNVIQHGVKIGANVLMWSGNHIGHRSIIEDHVFVSSHCVLSGYCRIGEYSFLGVNSTYNDHVTVAPDCLIGSGAVVIRDTQQGSTYVGNPAKLLTKSKS